MVIRSAALARVALIGKSRADHSWSPKSQSGTAVQKATSGGWFRYRSGIADGARVLPHVL